MLKIFRYLKAKEWMLYAVCAAFVVLQVFIELKIPEYTAEITRLIQTPGSPVGDVWLNGLYMLLCAFGSAACLLAVGFFASLLGARLARRLRDELYDKVMSFSPADINRFSVATLITRSTNDVTQVQALFAMGAQFLFRAPIMSVWAIVKLVGYEWQYSVMTAVAIGVIIVVSAIILAIALPKFKRIQSMTDDLNRIMREQLTGVRVVRAYNAEGYSEQKFGAANDELTRINVSVNRAFVTVNPILNLIMSALTIGVFWIGAYVVKAAAGAERLTAFTDMMALSRYTTMVINGFLLIVIAFVMTPRALVSAHRITEVLDVTPSVLDPQVPAAIPDAIGEVEFKDVSFCYPDAQENVIEHISFRAERGQTVAFIGSTGSGKSTLINLIPRFYDVTGGSVTVDGVDVRQYAQRDLRRKIGYVPQRAVLFRGDVAGNVNYGDSAEARTAADVEEAVRIAQADFVYDMEGGIEASIAQGGTNVSGGQRQRLAIARAVCRRPEIYIFDDSFSALDFKTDRTLRTELAKATAGATKLIVAQRVGTIMDADKIIVLDNGKQVGEGTHGELMRSCEIYREIALSQLSEEELK